MRLTSEMWVKALVRRVFGDGLFAVIERQGSPEAGAIFIRIRGRDGRETLLGPAPQSHFDTAKPLDRSFERRLDKCESQEIDALLEREKKFDPDFWVVEIETDEPEDYVSVMPV
ncbi:DUF1491 family protein [Hoeflea sp. TYP-13]|uniref:DUF1491 family protein n=1 Tax=Hoeflea sp. TYP-13 TaxID=3230023 RepID=UPI0034C5C281